MTVHAIGNIIDFSTSYLATNNLRQRTSMEFEEMDTTEAPTVNEKNKLEESKKINMLRNREHSLLGPSQGKLISEAQLLRDCIFVMQNIDGHYIRWNEANQKFQLVNNVKCNICDESMANKLAFLGFLGNFIFLLTYLKTFFSASNS